MNTISCRLFPKLLIACLLIVVSPTNAEELSLKDLSIQCRGCHGEEGNNPMFEWMPAIGGNYKSYIVNTLYAYKQGKRQPVDNARDPRHRLGPGLMALQTALLSDAEIDRLAEYFAVDGKYRGNLAETEPENTTANYIEADEFSGGGKTILIFGASGSFGRILTEEALNRGFKVIGVSRNPAKFTNQHPNFSSAKGDITDVESTLKLVSNPEVDVVVNSVGGGVRPGQGPKDTTQYKAAVTMVEVLPQLGDKAPRVIQVGGATSLNVNGQHALDYYAEKNSRAEMLFAPPKGALEYALFNGHYEALKVYRASEGLSWTVISPSYVFDMGPRTDKFRYDLDEMIFNEETGIARISRADLAVAIVNEINAENFINRRFTVGY